MAEQPTFTEAWLPGHDSINFYTRTYAAESPRAVVIFVHGFSEHVGRYEWAHSVCAMNGLTVFAYDQRGYGRTALDRAHKSKGSAFGKTSLHDGLLDFEWWLRHLKREYPDLPLFALGNSMVSSTYRARHTSDSLAGRRLGSIFCDAHVATAV